MQNDLDTMMAAAASPANQAHNSALHEFLAHQQHPQAFATQSPGGGNNGDFAELLAEFTLQGNVMTPDALGKSPEVSSGSGSGYEGEVGLDGRRSLSHSPHGHARAYSGGDAHEFGRRDPQPDQQQIQLATAIASMEPAVQSQLLAALLAQSQSSQSGSPNDSYHPPQHQQQQQHQYPPRTARASSAFSQHQAPLQRVMSHRSEPPSQQGSPQPYQQYSNAPSPLSLQQQLGQYQHAASPVVHQTALNTSLPPSLVSSPLNSPYLLPSHPSPFYPPTTSASVSLLQIQQQQQLQHDAIQQAQQQQQQQQQQHAHNSHVGPSMSNFDNAFSPRPMGAAGRQSADIAAQLNMETYLPPPQNYPGGGDQRVRNSVASGSSYSTTTGSQEWRENDFMFSPLMSPGMNSAPSAYSQASSLPPSGSCGPPNQSVNNLVPPPDFFTPLSSPALRPQGFQPEYPTNPTNDYPNLPANGIPWNRSASAANLQGLVDQTQAMGFDQMGRQGSTQSMNGYYSPNQGTMSPRMVPTGSNDPGAGTSTGSGKRGAGPGSRKSRPSPLLKPTPDNAVRKKKGTDRRSSSIGSAGVRSVTTSPYLGPSFGMSSTSPAITSSRTSPADLNDLSNGSNNTPSPVDLALHDAPMDSAASSLMGPPPPPSMSRRTSLTRPFDASTSTWMNPVTPASFMNLPLELANAGLASLPLSLPSVNHSLQRQSSSGSSTPRDMSIGRGTQPYPHQTNGFEDPSSSSSTIAPKPKLAKKPILAKALALLAPGSEEPAGVSGTPAAVKGKGKALSVASSGAAGGRKLAKAASKSGAGPKLKPLLASGVPSDALARLSAKSNYQNIMEGRGVDVLGFDATTVTSLNTNQGPGADTRRTSHKAAEQKRRDSLKQCFEELRRILPPMANSANEDDRRPGEGNVGGQRGGSVDPENPNRGVSKVALLRRSNEYVGMLHDRIDRRDAAIDALRTKLEQLREAVGGDFDEELEGFDLDNLDKDEKKAGTMESYECLDSDDEQDYNPKPKKATPAPRRKSNAESDKGAGGKPGASASRRSARQSIVSNYEEEEGDLPTEMEVEV